MARDVMAVRLHLAQIRVLEVVEDTPGALVVSVESTLLRLRCAQCGFKCRRVHDRRAKRVRDLEVSGRRTTLVWQRRRMVCSNCASRFLEDHPAFEGALTARLARRVVADAKVMTFSAAARRHGVHWHAVRALVDTWSALVAERRRSRRCSVLLVDETSMRNLHHELQDQAELGGSLKAWTGLRSYVGPACAHRSRPRHGADQRRCAFAAQH